MLDVPQTTQPCPKSCRAVGVPQTDRNACDRLRGLGDECAGSGERIMRVATFPASPERRIFATNPLMCVLKYDGCETIHVRLVELSNNRTTSYSRSGRRKYEQESALHSRCKGQSIESRRHGLPASAGAIDLGDDQCAACSRKRHLRSSHGSWSRLQASTSLIGTGVDKDNSDVPAATSCGQT
jgi:hypothetical protein